MKRYLTTIIALAVLAVVAVAVFVILRVTGQNPLEPSPTEEPVDTTYYKLLEFEYDDVTEVESSVNGQVITLQRVTETVDGKTSVNWVCTSDDSIDANTSGVNSLVSGILSSCSGTIIPDVDDLGDYGFDSEGKSENYIRMTNSEGLTTTLYIGQYDYSRSYRYVHPEDGSNHVYKVNVYSTDRMMFQKQAVIQMKAFAYLSTDTPKQFTVYQRGAKELELACVNIDEESGAEWTVSYPMSRKAQNDAVNELIDAMKGIPLADIVADDVTEDGLAKYGLGPAEIEYYLYLNNDKGELIRYMLKVGNKTEDGGYYFCIVDDPVDGIYEICTVQTQYVYRSLNALDYIDAYLYMEDSDLLSRVDIDISGEQHTMVYTYETKKTTDKDGNETEEEVVTRFFDGKEAIDDDTCLVVVTGNKYTPPTPEELALNRDGDVGNDIMTENPYEAFNRLLLSLYVNLVIKEIDVEEPAQEDVGETIAVVTYTERDGDVYKIELKKRDNTTAFAYVNGQYAGGYARTTGIFGEEYLSADYAASLKCLKILMAMIP